MNSQAVFLATFLSSAVLCPPLTGTSPPIDRTWLPPVQAIARAVRLPDPSERQQEYVRAVRAAVLSDDVATRREAGEFLSRNSRWLDISSIESILLESGPRYGSHFDYRGLLDDEELWRSPRDHRMNVYRDAISNGMVTLPRGWGLPRSVAMHAAALEGIEELAPLVERYHATLPPELQRGWGYPLDYLRAMFELRAGAKTRADATLRACERLAAFTDDALRTRLASDDGFRRAALDVAEIGCALNPFTGKRATGCDLLVTVYRRQKKLEEAKEKGTEESRSAGSAAVHKWLEYVDAVLRPDALP